MSNELFRKKSLNKVISPDNLDDYIQVSSPGIWLLLISVIVLLVGALIWGFFGNIDKTVETVIKVEDGEALCYVADEDDDLIETGMIVEFEDMEAVITEIELMENEFEEIHLQLSKPIADGFYDGSIITESIKPASFILN